MKLRGQAAIEYLFMVAVALVIVYMNYHTLVGIAKRTVVTIQKFSNTLQQSLQKALEEAVS